MRDKLAVCVAGIRIARVAENRLGSPVFQMLLCDQDRSTLDLVLGIDRGSSAGSFADDQCKVTLGAVGADAAPDTAGLEPFGSADTAIDKFK